MRFRSRHIWALALPLATGCVGRHATAMDGQAAASLAEARRGFTTQLVRKEKTDDPVAAPPAGMFDLVHYTSKVGSLPAYVGTRPADGKKHPAIIWLVGGFDNSIGDTSWAPAKPENDQSAKAFREAGIVTMYPALRGGNRGPGYKEGFYGEVDDVLAAADYLAKLDYVDPKRIYLGGHSTGGTLALLTVESSGRFRAVFAFGPVHDIRAYGQDSLPFNTGSREEVALRSPIKWLDAVKTPTFVFEGSEHPSNIAAVGKLQESTQNPHIRFYSATGYTHFSILAAVTPIVAKQILADDESTVNIKFSGAPLMEIM